MSELISKENETLENSDATTEEKSSHADVRQGKRKRITRQFPALPYEDCVVLGSAIWEHASGLKIRRLTLFDHIGKSPESGPSRTLITSAGKYGIITGSTQSEYIELTATGSSATNPESSLYEKKNAEFELAIKNNDYFNALYEQYSEMKVPSNQVMKDFLEEKGLDEDNQQRCVDLFLANAKYIGLIKVLSGTERIISIEHLLEDIDAEQVGQASLLIQTDTRSAEKQPIDVKESDHSFENICFYITPIGSEGSEQRQHSDLFMGSIVEPAVESLGLKVVRSDTINAAGMITSQIIEHLVKSKLVIADLSFHNPNVFYELSLRHSLGKPVIHLIRSADTIPFDIHSFRTIIIDDSSIYSFVPQIESYKATVAAQARQVINDDSVVDNPITAFFSKHDSGKQSKAIPT